jgi:hypothetical protein
VPRIRCALILIAVLAACSDEVGRLSIEEGFKCANLGFEGHPGTFNQRGSAIGYSYEIPNGTAKVVVTFDKRRRPISTFFESAPHGSHQELMEAAGVIKDCVAYGPRSGSESRGAVSAIGR